MLVICDVKILKDSSVITFKNRALDNTLPQSAYAYFLNPENPLNESKQISRDCFLYFIEAYINSPKRMAPIPAESQGSYNIDEPFVSHWQSRASIIKNSQNKTGTSIDESELYNAFLVSISKRPKQWASWIKFQWTNDIVGAFQSRVEDWREQLNSSSEYIKKARLEKELGITKITPILEKELSILESNQSIDRSYDVLSDDIQIDIPGLAMSYAINWFMRGSAYRDKNINHTTGFHILRTPATKSVNDKYSVIESVSEWRFGIMVEALINSGAIDRNAEKFVDILYQMRMVVQNDEVYAQEMNECESVEDPVKQRIHYKNSLARVLHKSGLKVPHKETSILNSDVNGFIEKYLEGIFKDNETYKKFFSPFVAGTVGMATSSKLANELIFTSGKHVLGDSIWHHFYIPGLQRI